MPAWHSFPWINHLNVELFWRKNESISEFTVTSPHWSPMAWVTHIVPRVSYSQCHGCWWPGGIRNQGIKAATVLIWFSLNMMTSSNGNIFRVNGLLCGEFSGPRWIPRTKASDAELWCFLWSTLNKRLCKQSLGWWSETPSSSLWRHRNNIPMPALKDLRFKWDVYHWDISLIYFTLHVEPLITTPINFNPNVDK